jgi:dihydrofolate reductase
VRELVYYVAVSVDGFIAAPDGSFDVFPTEGDHMDTIFRDYTDALPGVALDALGLTPGLSRFDTVLMGWNTYAVGLPEGMASPYPHLRQYVFSRRRSPDAPEVIHRDNPVATVRALKAEPAGSGIWLCGGGQLASALAGEIDRLILKVNPVLLGAGIPLFAASGSRFPARAELVRSTGHTSGVLITEYTLTRPGP